MDPDELDELADRARVVELIAELDVGARDVIDGMLDAPAAALPLLEYAREHSAKLKSPGGFVVLRWRDRRRVPLPVWPAPMSLEADEEAPEGYNTVPVIEAGLSWARRNGAPAFAIAYMQAELETARRIEALEAELDKT